MPSVSHEGCKGRGTTNPFIYKRCGCLNGLGVVHSVVVDVAPTPLRQKSFCSEKCVDVLEPISGSGLVA